MSHHADTNLQLNDQETATLINLDITFRAKAVEGQDSNFEAEMDVRYRNMTRVQFNWYEREQLLMWLKMNSYQSHARVPEICDIEDPCDIPQR